MPADELGRYMTSPEFFARAKAAVEKAVRELEAKGIQPCYMDRETGRLVGDGRRYRITLPDPDVQAVVLDLFSDGTHGDLMDRLVAFASNDHGARLVSDATRTVAGALLLAKTAMPHEATSFSQTVRDQMASVRPYPELVELARLLIEAERATQDDAFRDRNIIPDALFDARIEAITEALAQ
ncbi:MAG: hypothetical protein EPN70_08535 [Paraburkholderia sp.]|uniref:hypothetical protein n=1 Tax=Paraburkholderia sp. TaxID=1926495 RepID=UPI0012282E62|nr:hypothetical protein [Paraburkholderia sp.]TAM05447.1 MAG: hypothetical protein EPN70_08535 [Paraburkholderia sp.]TAM27879.1 MAG: hypothetical protein EPN59_16960 [Paraburkholderia sp.]